MHRVHFREPKGGEWRSSGDHVQIVRNEDSTQPFALNILLHCSQRRLSSGIVNAD